MGISDGQAVDAADTNPAFINKNTADQMPNQLDFIDTRPAAGPVVTDIQREVNSLDAFTGRPAGSAYNATPVWVYNDVGSSTDTVRLRADLLTAKFNASTGHKHTGVAGDAPKITGSDLASVPLKGYVNQGTDLTGVTGVSTDVSTPLAGKSPSVGSTSTGVVVTAPQNKVLIRQSTGSNQDDPFEDSLGNVVYGRLTYLAGVWTLSYYVNLAGTETAYSFTGSNGVRWYYQELFSPMVNPPVYSEFASIPSDNATADVITATTTLQGKVSLATASQSVGSANSGGTANASVANADHVHQGVHSVNGGSSNLFGDVIIAGAGGSVASQAGQTVTITSPALASTAPADVGSAAAVGVGTTSARADHVHRGVTSVQVTSALYGAITFAATGSASVSQSGQTITINATAGATSPLTTKGDIWVYSTVDTRLPIGTNGQVLTADSAQTTGMKWAAVTAYTPPVTTKGDLFGYDTAPTRVPVGADGTFLSADSTQATGVKWATPGAATSQAIYSRIVGSAAQVTAGTATDSTIGAAITAATAGTTIRILPGNYTETVSVAKQLSFEGGGYGTYLTGTWTFASGSSYCTLKGLRISGNITVNSGVIGIWVIQTYFDSTSTFVDNSGNSIANILSAIQG